MIKAFGLLFLSTGIFAIVGALYTWGDGNIFLQKDLAKVLIPWADIILTGPISLASGYGILRKQEWGHFLGLMTSGIYIFGSVMVFISMFWNNNFPLFIVIPSITGLSIALGYSIFTIRKSINKDSK